MSYNVIKRPKDTVGMRKKSPRWPIPHEAIAPTLVTRKEEVKNSEKQKLLV